MTHSHSDEQRTTRSRYFAASLVAVVAVGLAGIGTFGALVTTDRYIVTEDHPISEDQYVTAVSAVVDGHIDGDLTVFTGDLTISGSVAGDVSVVSSGSVVITDSGRIAGSLKGVAVNVNVVGDVGDDIFMTGASVVIEEGATIGRDAIVVGGSVRVEGVIGRDVRGRMGATTVDGTVGGDIDIATQRLSIGATASVAGDVLYRSPSGASIDESAEIVGTITRLPGQSNFLYSIVLMLANVVGFLGFLVAGFVALWLLRGTGSRAVGAVLERPIRSLLVGALVVVALPLVVVLLAATLVGLPLAVALAVVGIVGFIVGPVPAVAAMGNRVLLRRGGLFGAFLAGAVLWYLGIWLIPVVGGLIYVVGMVWGVGGWVLGALAARRSDPVPAALIPVSAVAPTELPEDWTPPLAPRPATPARKPTAPEPRISAEAVQAPAPDEGTSTGEVAEHGDSAAEPQGSDPQRSAMDPDAPRDVSHDGDAISFSAAEPDDDDVEPTQSLAEEDSAGGEQESLSSRFQALRDELDAAGTEEPTPKPSPEEGDDSPPSDPDWGLR